MGETSFYNPSWYRATTLTERIASLRAVQGTVPKLTQDADRGQERFRPWRSQPPFSNSSYFAGRLEMDGIGEDEMLYILAEPIEAVCDRFPIPPIWLTDLVQAFCHAPGPKAISSIRLKVGSVPELLTMLKPLLTRGRKDLRDGVHSLVQKQTNLPFDPFMIEDLLCPHLFRRMVEMVSGTMVLELNVARLQGLLEGKTPEARFRSFFRRLRQRDTALALLHEYPVLARDVSTYTNRWVATNLEFLRHLKEDWNAICATFNMGNDPGRLIELVRPGHDCRGGRSVQIARFSSGLRIVYKPRSLALDLHFQELLVWCNQRGYHPQFKTLNVLDRGSHGWVEFIFAEGCSSSDEISRFYGRQGSYLALLYALEATDFHYGNVIAQGEQPMLIDLEALFHPRLRCDEADATEQYTKSVHQSVLRVGLLPHHAGPSAAEHDAVDLSGLGAEPGQLTRYPLPYWELSGTDEMRLVHKRVTMSGGQNRPSLKGTNVKASDHVDSITAGFTAMYHLLLMYRDELLASNGPVLRFAQDEIRAVLRPSRSYNLLLRNSYHPDILRDALKRDRLIDWLWAMPFDDCVAPNHEAVDRLPFLTKIIPAERQDLWKGDIPIFTARPGSRHVWTSSNEVIANFFDEPSMNRVKRRIQELSEDDLSHQLSLIHTSLVRPAVGPDQVHSSSQAATPPEPGMVGGSTR